MSVPDARPVTGAAPLPSRPDRRALRAAIGIVVSIVCLAIAVRGVDPAQTAEVLAGARLPLVGLGVLLVAVDVCVRARRWQVLLRPVRLLPYGPVLRCTSVGFLANAVLPARLGEIVRSVLLGREQDLSRSTVLGTVIVERVLDMAVLALLGTSAVLALGVHGAAEEAAIAGLILALALAGLITGAVILRTVPLPAVVARVAARRPGLAGLAARLQEGLVVAADRRALTGGLLLSALAWAIGVGTWLAGSAALGVSLDLPEAVLATTAVSLVTAIPSGPGYVGSFELAAVAVLGLFGIDPATALGVGILVHAMILGVTVAGGTLALAGPPLRRRLGHASLAGESAR